MAAAQKLGYNPAALTQAQYVDVIYNMTGSLSNGVQLGPNSPIVTQLLGKGAIQIQNGHVQPATDFGNQFANAMATYVPLGVSVLGGAAVVNAVNQSGNASGVPPGSGNPNMPSNPNGTGNPSGNGSFNPTALLALAPLIATMLRGTPSLNPGQMLGTIPGGQDILNSVIQNNAQKAPLRAAVTQQAMNMLPNSAFPGGRPASLPTGPSYAPASMPSSSSGPGLGSALGLLGGGAGLGLLLNNLFGGKNAGNLNFGDWLKSLGGNNSGFPSQFNPPPGGVLGTNPSNISAGPTDTTSPNYNPNDPSLGTDNPGDFTGE